MSWLDIASTCETRYEVHRPCKDCLYYGKICERIKHRNNVNRPSDLMDNYYMSDNGQYVRKNRR